MHELRGDRRGSNPRQPHSQCSALPAELRPPLSSRHKKEEEASFDLATSCSRMEPGHAWTAEPGALPLSYPSSREKMCSGVVDGARTHDRRNHNPELYPLSYDHPRAHLENLVGRRGFEPRTNWLKASCSDQTELTSLNHEDETSGGSPGI
jgi:hypothetical protein